MKKTISLICVVVFMATLMVGCGNTSSTPEASTVASGSEKPYDGKTLTVLFMSGVYADAARALADTFQEQTGAKLEVLDFPYATLHEKEIMDLSNATGAYDVISIASQWDGEFAPFMEDLQPYIDRDGYDTGDFIENVFNQSGIWEGKIYGLPTCNTPMCIAYRTDLIDEIPNNWAEYNELIRSLTDVENGFYGVSTPGIGEQSSCTFSVRLWSAGGAWADKDWNVAINSQEARDALKGFKEILDYADPAALSWGVDESINAFLHGKAAICEAWPTLGITLNADDPEQSEIVGNWAIAPFPYEKNGATLLSAWDIGIPKGAAQKDLGWEFIKLYCSTESQKMMYDDFAICPPRVSFWRSEEIQQSKISMFEGILETSNLIWRIPASAEAQDIIGKGVGQFCSGQSDLEGAISFMEKGLSDALLRNPPPEGSVNENR